MTPIFNNPVALQDYIAGRMSDTDIRAFEEQLQTDPSLARDLEESLRLREGLEMLREQGVLGQLQRPRPRAFFVRAAAAAAAVIVLCVALYYVQQSTQHSTEASTPTVAASLAALGTRSTPPLNVVQRYSFATVREAISTPELALPASGALELRALTALTDSHRTYRVTLEKIDHQGVSPIGTAEHLTADADGFVVLYADASKLQPGEYSLHVAPDEGDNTTGERFTFRLRALTAHSPGLVTLRGSVTSQEAATVGGFSSPAPVQPPPRQGPLAALQPPPPRPHR
jgi:hypothetical protein